MEKREARIYYIQEKEGQRAVLIFDAGHENGDVHVYEYVKSYSTEEIQEEVKRHLKVAKLSKGTELTALNTWIEKNYGFPMSWKLLEG
jgi:uroporphyrinogen-III decarboxylase